MIPNIYILPGIEVDIASIKDKHFYDVETKVSRGDFKRDFGKRKHRMIERGRYPANYFFFACPAGLIEPQELPKYAGLLWVDQNGRVSQKKKPRKLQRKPQRDRILPRLAMKLDKIARR